MSGMSGRAFTRPTTNRTSRVYIWAFGDALVRQAEARVRIEATLGQGLTPLHCPVVREGAFELCRMLWRLSWPSPCRF